MDLSKSVVLLLSCFLHIAPRSAKAVVHLPFGAVVGAPCSPKSDTLQYFGIPFAAPPVGERRFRPPVPFEGRYGRGVLNATTRPPACIQMRGPSSRLPDDFPFSEDCLYLNIWTPARAHPKSKLPVRVYIHGGGWISKSASVAEFSGCSSAGKSDTILVNIQYRLGMFGFLSHPATYAESNSTGNWGVMDQQVALRWVQRHIVAFGGDPSRLLLFGQSAGAWSVSLHVTLPSSAGLFTSAISESQPGWDFQTANEAFTRVSTPILARLACLYGLSSERQLSCVRALSADAILSSISIPDFLHLSEPAHQFFSPVIDHTFISQQILHRLRRGDFNKVPFLLGSNSQEGLFLMPWTFPEASKVSEGALITFLKSVYPRLDPSQVLNLYPLDNFRGSHSPSYLRFATVWTDVYMTCPIHRALALLEAHHTPVYRYLFTHVPSCPYADLGRGAGEGVAHDDELYFVFNQVTNLPQPRPQPQQRGTCNFTQAERELAGRCVHAWASMARYGRPMTSATRGDWPAWRPEDARTVILDTETRVKSEHVAQSRACQLFNLHQAMKEEQPGKSTLAADGDIALDLHPQD